MPKITFIRKDKTEVEIDAAEGLSIMEVAIQNGIDEIEGACGGGLACATCHVYVHPDFQEKCKTDGDDISDEEEDMLDLAFDLKKSSRLGCQIIMDKDKDGLKVALPGTDVDW
ncbi:MAG: 2Fe-2S iron-sulfur cluster binding domain-containing protein [Alphaproteobacteria bacterium]|nr:2Fe-2S iron-sulfur cluster binding domain-containing protein [Alphaproteobacteria bacterium]